ncbi:hypothetical protein D3C80_1595550 [compost metagenome]
MGKTVSAVAVMVPAQASVNSGAIGVAEHCARIFAIADGKTVAFIVISAVAVSEQVPLLNS